MANAIVVFTNDCPNIQIQSENEYFTLYWINTYHFHQQPQLLCHFPLSVPQCYPAEPFLVRSEQYFLLLIVAAIPCSDDLPFSKDLVCAAVEGLATTIKTKVYCIL